MHRNVLVILPLKPIAAKPAQIADGGEEKNKEKPNANSAGKWTHQQPQPL